jgi:hypothetical protein
MHIDVTPLRLQFSGQDIGGLKNDLFYERLISAFKGNEFYERRMGRIGLGLGNFTAFNVEVF